MSEDYPEGRFKVTFHIADIAWPFVGLHRMKSPDMRLVYRWTLWLGPISIFRFSSMTEALASVEARKVMPVVKP